MDLITASETLVFHSITAKGSLIQDVSFLLREPRHDNAKRHPQEVMNLEETVQQEDNEHDDAKDRTNSHVSVNSNVFTVLIPEALMLRSKSLVHFRQRSIISRFALVEVTKNR